MKHYLINKTTKQIVHLGDWTSTAHVKYSMQVGNAFANYMYMNPTAQLEFVHGMGESYKKYEGYSDLDLLDYDFKDPIINNRIREIRFCK